MAATAFNLSNALPTAQDNNEEVSGTISRHNISNHLPAVAQGTGPHLKSCVACRRRKVRCDKRMPCGNCSRINASCSFTRTNTASRARRTTTGNPNMANQQQDARREQLLSRLQGLEDIVKGLQPVRHQRKIRRAPGGERMSGACEGSLFSSRGDKPVQDSQFSIRDTSGGDASGSIGESSSMSNLRASRPINLQKNFERLAIRDRGQTRYISSAFWSEINDELDNLHIKKPTPSEAEEHRSKGNGQSKGDPSGGSALPYHGFLFGHESRRPVLRGFHPSVTQILYLWKTYQQNVDPLIKILHIPTMDKLIQRICNDMESLAPETEALMFSIFYAAASSLDEDEINANLWSTKAVLLTQYRHAVEQALATAGFLTSSDMVTLQAFTLFLELLRQHGDARLVWTLTGLAIRISQSIGLHRDGANFPNITPFEIEMRRRLWWTLCTLDLRAAEDQGTDLAISDTAFDTQLPLNINDSQINPESTVLPSPHDGTTDLTFSLIRYEICTVARRLHQSTCSSACGRSSVENRERMIRDLYDRVQDKYLKESPDDNSPLGWAAVRFSRAIISKMTAINYQSALYTDHTISYPQDSIPNRLFTAATETFEFDHLLKTNPRARKWRWLFYTYTHFNAAAYVLTEVSRRPWSASVERAWAALDSVLSSCKSLDLEKVADNTCVRLPLKWLYSRAREHREAEIQRLRADPQAINALDIVTPPPLTFSDIFSSAKAFVARERWHKLIDGSTPSSRSAQHGCSSKGLGFSVATAQQTRLSDAGNDLNRSELASFDRHSDVKTAFPVMFPTEIWTDIGFDTLNTPIQPEARSAATRTNTELPSLRSDVSRSDSQPDDTINDPSLP